MGGSEHVRGWLVSVRLHALRRIPPRIRGPVVQRLVRRLAPPEMRRGSSYDACWWDTFYADVDPFEFDSNPREAVKYARTLELCGDGPFARALELGCAEGVFTELLAERCDELLAVDISDIAVRRAARRTRGREGVRCERRTLPREFPEGMFDLVVASDVFYYWQQVDLQAAVPLLEAAVAPGGRMVSVHYVPPMGAILDGNEVHDLLTERLGLPQVHSELTMLGSAPYRFDVFERPRRTGISPRLTGVEVVNIVS